MRDFLVLARPYWRGEKRWAARGLLGVLLALNLGLVYVSVLINHWNKLFYDAIQNRDFAGFLAQLGHFCVLAAAFVAIVVYQVYFRQLLEIRWRRWLTAWYLDRWLGQHAYYGLQLKGGEADNPDQRIAEDLRTFIASTLDLGLGLLSSTVTVFSFASILWGLSGTLELSLGGMAVAVPGYLLWAAIAYSALGTWLSYRIGRPLVALNFDQQRYEANFRFALVRFRENTEPVALYGGEEQERVNFGGRLAALVTNWRAIMRRQKRLSWFSTSYHQAALVFPILVASPRYFSGALQLGGLTQSASAFTTMQGAMSWFVDAYGRIAEWTATIERLIRFDRAIAAVRADRVQSTISLSTEPHSGLLVEQLDLALPDGRLLIKGASIGITPGEAVLLTGPPGSGKSTLLRAIAGIWPYGRGRIVQPAGARLLFVPQRPYVPIGRLREVVSYPDSPTAFSEEQICAALTACGLAALCSRLEESANWGQQLSPGEQQRIAFARALLLEPDWLFLDNAASALHAGDETQLYRLLKERLPQVTLFYVSHRPALAGSRGRWIEVCRDASGPGWLEEPGLEPHAVPLRRGAAAL